ncbi:MAG: hypothetical protein ACK2UU_07740 [Anaerolineae bacterium]
MKYGQIAGSKRINAFIYDCFSHLVEEDQQKFADAVGTCYTF